LAASQNTGICLRKLRLSNHPCWATGVSGDGVGAGNLFDESFLKGNENGSLLLGAFDESASAPFGTLDAEGDPDCPSEGYSSIDQALNTLRQGKVGV
jgi:3,4-dihydroxy 2-butanone 4-phosphate synthase/GTP cyclohydrolase II